ncbi:MAG: SOS response-associated peptidase [Candidatus Magasanikbacteria bacterium]|nr:SOS response-associated peptidase [Candidatus Magasanikbacteria bacterium]
MCGRTTIAVSKKALENRYNAEFVADFEPNYNAAPGQKLPIIKNTSKQEITLAKWGYLPKWLKDKRPQGFINSRSETIFEKPSFKKAIMQRRCLVPVDGFFEWDEDKNPFYIYLADNSIFSFAGIWESYVDEKNKEIPTYSILTTQPNIKISKIHDRMPVILKKSDEKVWLEENKQEVIKSFFKKIPESDIKLHRVTKQINNPANNKSELLKKIN